MNSTLKVCKELLSDPNNRAVCADVRLVVLQHLLEDSAELIALFQKAGAAVHVFIPKPYSIDPRAAEVMRQLNIPVVDALRDEIGSAEVVRGLMLDAIKLAKVDGKKVIFLDLGGYFAKPLVSLSAADAAWVLGVVEDTTFGHRRYLALEHALPVPVFSVARSRLKEVEAHHVGKEVVATTIQLLKELGISLTGKKALQLGYGMIGKSVVRALKSHDINVLVYDEADIENLHAFTNGCESNQRSEMIRSADIIFSATGQQALSADDISLLKPNAHLVSAGSQDIEFDLPALRCASVQVVKATPHIMRFTLRDGRNIFVLKEGTPVNFHTQSVPNEIIDLVFSEIVLSTIRLATESDRLPRKMLASSPASLSLVARKWLARSAQHPIPA